MTGSVVMGNRDQADLADAGRAGGPTPASSSRGRASQWWGDPPYDDEPTPSTVLLPSTSSTSIPSVLGSRPIIVPLAHTQPFATNCTNGAQTESGIGVSVGQTFVHSAIIVRLPPTSDTTCLIEYELSRQFSRLQLVIGATDDSPSDCVAGLKVDVDGQVLFDNSVRFGEVLAVDLDVAGAMRLRLEVRSTPLYECSVVLGYPTLTG